MKRTPISPDLCAFPAEFHPLMGKGRVFDSSSSPEARVYYLDSDGGCFLKSAPKNALKVEADMTAYFHRKGLGAEVLCYLSGDRDWLLTRGIPGEDCTHPEYMADPKRLSETTGSLLRALHETSPDRCPAADRLGAYRRKLLQSSKYEPELFQGVWSFSTREEAAAEVEAGFRYLKPDTLIHGDYCLPNIMLERWQFTGFIDLGGAGFGDRHMDILWGLWTLNFNLHTTEFFDRFLDAYGRERVEPEKLRTLAALEILT